MCKGSKGHVHPHCSGCIACEGYEGQPSRSEEEKLRSRHLSRKFNPETSPFPVAIYQQTANHANKKLPTGGGAVANQKRAYSVSRNPSFPWKPVSALSSISIRSFAVDGCSFLPPTLHHGHPGIMLMMRRGLIIFSAS